MEVVSRQKRKYSHHTLPKEIHTRSHKRLNSNYRSVIRQGTIKKQSLTLVKKHFDLN